MRCCCCFFKQKTAYEMRISDWSSDVCSSDLGASAAEILDQLQHGQPIRRLVTIPEGMPSILVHERLMAVPYLIGTIPVPNEGSILPDIYSYRRGESRSTVLKRMQEEMTRELNALWAKGQTPSARKTPSLKT